jgi:hypothetical protein
MTSSIRVQSPAGLISGAGNFRKGIPSRVRSRRGSPSDNAAPPWQTHVESTIGSTGSTEVNFTGTTPSVTSEWTEEVPADSDINGNVSEICRV